MPLVRSSDGNEPRTLASVARRKRTATVRAARASPVARSMNWNVPCVLSRCIRRSEEMHRSTLITTFSDSFCPSFSSPDEPGPEPERARASSRPAPRIRRSSTPREDDPLVQRARVEAKGARGTRRTSALVDERATTAHRARVSMWRGAPREQVSSVEGQQSSRCSAGTDEHRSPPRTPARGLDRPRGECQRAARGRWKNPSHALSRGTRVEAALRVRHTGASAG